MLNYSKRETVRNVDDIDHELIRESLKKTGINKSVDLTIIADIQSEGSGLGSSSSLTIGLLNAMYTYQEIIKTVEELANDACEIEIGICQKPIGKQDQFVASYGGFCDITFNKDNSTKVNKIKIIESNLNEINSEMLLFFTGITRKSEQILTEQRNNIPKKLLQLNQLKSFAGDAIDFIQNKKYGEVGHLLNRSWELKKQLSSNVSNEILDKMYSKAIKAGATGGKILGAGGGGFLLLYVKTENQNSVRESLSEFNEMPFKFEKEGSKIILNSFTNEF
jgi:D-glycero-alpha-D-manno-heptose-7-phosphate kinase